MMQRAAHLLCWLHGGSRPHEVAAGVALGLVAGFASGWNLWLLAILLAVAALNVHLRSLVLAWAIGFAAAWLLMPATYQVGHLIVGQAALSGWLAKQGGSLPVALLDLDRFIVPGGLVIAFFTALPLAISTAYVTRRAKSHDEFVAESTGALDRLVIAWIAEDRSASNDDDRRLRLRPYWTLAVTATVVVEALVIAALVPRSVERTILAHMSQLSGLHASADDVAYSAGDGRMNIEGLRFTDPKTGDVRIGIGKLTAHIADSIQAMHGSCHLQQVVVDDVEVSHDAPGHDTESDHESANRVAKGSPDFHNVAELPIERHLANGPMLIRRLAPVADCLAVLERLVAYQSQAIAPDDAWSVPRRELSRLRATTHARPLLTVEELWVRRLPEAWSLGSQAMLRAEHFGTARNSVDSPPRIVLIAPALHTQIEMTPDVDTASPTHHVRFQTSNVRLADLLDRGVADNRLFAYGGRLRCQGAGVVRRSGMELDLHLEIERPLVRLSGSAPLAGVEAYVWNELVARATRLQADLQLVGSWEDPHLHVDTGRLATHLRGQLGEYVVDRSANDRPAADTPTARQTTVPRADRTDDDRADASSAATIEPFAPTATSTGDPSRTEPSNLPTTQWSQVPVRQPAASAARSPLPGPHAFRDSAIVAPARSPAASAQPDYTPVRPAMPRPTGNVGLAEAKADEDQVATRGSAFAPLVSKPPVQYEPVPEEPVAEETVEQPLAAHVEPAPVANPLRSGGRLTDRRFPARRPLPRDQEADSGDSNAGQDTTPDRVARRAAPWNVDDDDAVIAPIGSSESETAVAVSPGPIDMQLGYDQSDADRSLPTMAPSVESVASASPSRPAAESRINREGVLGRAVSDTNERLRGLSQTFRRGVRQLWPFDSRDAGGDLQSPQLEMPEAVVEVAPDRPYVANIPERPRDVNDPSESSSDDRSGSGGPLEPWYRRFW